MLGSSSPQKVSIGTFWGPRINSQDDTRMCHSEPKAKNLETPRFARGDTESARGDTESARGDTESAGQYKNCRATQTCVISKCEALRNQNLLQQQFYEKPHGQAMGS